MDSSLFYQPLRVKTPDANVLVWGCTHFGHECRNWDTPLWKQRGFNSLDDHDLSLVERWNAKANENTIGFLLGDLMFGQDAEKNLLHIFHRLSFKTLYVLPGNHTAGWKQLFTKSNGDLMLGEKKVVFVPNYLEAFINGQAVVMSHYPILSWNGQGGGSFMLFSHVHGNLEKSEVGRQYLNSGAKCLEMSVEKWPDPADFGEIRKLLNKRESVSFDHHSTSTQNPF